MKKLMTLMIALFVAAGVWAEPNGEKFGGAVIDFDGKMVDFTWYNGFGDMLTAVDVNGQPYNTDGGYFMLLLFDADFLPGDEVKLDDPIAPPLLKFSDVFEELTIGGITYHDPIDGSMRLYADFAGEPYDGIYGTRVLSDNAVNGYTLRGTDLNGALFYGIMFDQDGTPYDFGGPGKGGEDVEPLGWVASVFPFPFLAPPKNGAPAASLPVTYRRKEGAGGGYMLAIAFFDEFRDVAGDPDAAFDNFEDFADRSPVFVKEYLLNVYNETQHIYYQTIEEALADGILNPGDVINIPGGTYSGDLNTTGLGGVTIYPGDSPACVTILGSFDVTDEDNLIIDIESDSPPCPDPDPGYTRLSIDGSANLNGISLDIQLAYLPDVGDTFQIIEIIPSGTLTGEFDEGGQIIVEYGGYEVTFSITYEEFSGVTLEVTDVTELPAIPLANWALYLGFILMAVFVVVRFRGRIL